jgi:hypothetical protein
MTNYESAARELCAALWRELAVDVPDEGIALVVTALREADAAGHARAQPIPMILFCPRCGGRHIDAPQPERGWTNPPHKSHECQYERCRHIWRPADVPTVGVERIETAGKADSVPITLKPDAEVIDIEWRATLLNLAAAARERSSRHPRTAALLSLL